MSDEKSDPPAEESKGSASAGPFDLKGVRQLLAMMQRFEVSEIDLSSGGEDGHRWQVRRGGVVPAVALPAPVPVAAAAPAPAPAAVPQAAPAAEAPAAPAGPAGKTIDSPTVGTFYASPSPDGPPFVKVGDSVQADTVVCIVEAMKVFNQIPADAAGTIAEILVKDGAAVEYGTPLFRLS